MSRIDETLEFIPVKIAILTVSDSRSLADDQSGQTLVDRLAAAGHHLAERTIVPDERIEIAQQLRQWIDSPVSPSTNSDLEDKVLARARELRSQSASR